MNIKPLCRPRKVQRCCQQCLVRLVQKVPTWALCFISHICGFVVAENIGVNLWPYLLAAMLGMGCVAWCGIRDAAQPNAEAATCPICNGIGAYHNFKAKFVKRWLICACPAGLRLQSVICRSHDRISDTHEK